jgi:hypothetical protein
MTAEKQLNVRIEEDELRDIVAAEGGEIPGDRRMSIENERPGNDGMKDFRGPEPAKAEMKTQICPDPPVADDDHSALPPVVDDGKVSRRR